MLSIILTVLITYIAVTLFGYVSHYALHQKWMGKYYKSHLIHHWKLYPPKNFTSDAYRDPGKDNTAFIFAAASMPLLIIPIVLGLVGILSFKIVLASIITMLILGLLHDRIHDAFHINNHWMLKFSPFKKWKELHFLHHVNPKKNFGIFVFHWDRLFKSFIKK